ncbi:MAG: TIGR03435 family protein [Verrucomicrobiota bacterium]
MPDLTDLELAREFACGHSDSAFAELVRRHVNLVFSVAQRWVGNAHDAEEVTQGVFIILAEKAGSLGDGTVLTGWLYEATRFTAAKFLRTRARRQRREQHALMESTGSEPDRESVWEQLALHLEEGMAQLSEKDRLLLALRFYENKTAAEAATLLGIGPWTAHKRSARAVEKLRTFFARRGIQISTTALVAAVSSQAVQAAPNGLAAAVVASAAKGAVASSSLLTLAHGTIKLMAWTKVKATLTTAAAVLFLGGTGTVIVHEYRVHSASRIYESIFAQPDSRSLQLLETAPPTLIVRPTRYPASSGGVWTPSGKGVYVNAPIAELLAIANTTPPTRMLLPATMPTGQYDFLATLPGRQNEALAVELKRQFKLSVRRETRSVDALLLEVKDPAKLKAHLTEGSQPTCYVTRDGDEEKLIFTNQNLARLAGQLEAYFGKPLLDQTEELDEYDVRFQWPRQTGPDRLKTIQGAMREQLEQIGLRLTPNREPINLLVVDLE